MKANHSQEPASEDLEKAAESAVLSVFTGYADPHTPFRAEKIALVSTIFKAGAQWQKEQMMKGAIEVRLNRDRLFNLKLIHDKYLDYKIGDKVKVIIIKE